MMIPLLVIRHASTDWNDAGLLQGRTDRPLTEAARERVRSWRLPEGWEAARCLASPLLRAMETARLLGLRVEGEARLTEMGWGAWEGRTLADLRSELGDTMKHNEARGLDFQPPAGESPRQVQDRIIPLLRSLAGPTIFVTHKGVLRALYALATGWDMQGKPADRLKSECAHAFAIADDDAVVVDRLNIPLVAA